MHAPVSTRPHEAVRSILPGAAAVFVGMRLVSAVVILVAQRHQPPVPGGSSTPYLGMTMHWDALWYRSIAMHGYPLHLPHHLDGAVAQNRWAFLPGFPFLTRGVMSLAPMGFSVAATLVNLAAGVVAACAIALLLERRIPRGATLGVVAVWAALPMAPTLQLAYSEALAMALLSLALLWLVREQWGRATLAALLLGLTRPILPPLALVYGVAVWRRWRRRTTEPVATSEGWRMLTGLVLTAAGSFLWALIAWGTTGVPGAYTLSEAAWHHGRVTPFSAMAPLGELVTHDHYRWLRIVVVVAIAVAALLVVRAVRSPRLDPLLVTWSAAYLVFDLAVANMHADELRMLLPLFPLVAVACGVASARLAPRWPLRVWAGVTFGILGQLAWVLLFVRYLPGATHPP